MAGDPYKELGVSKGASAEEIKKAFRKLAKELHPDKNPGDKVSEERFKRVTAAFDLLGDAEKRAKYDRGEIDADGREQFRGFSGGGGGRSGGFSGFGGSGARGGFEDIDLSDLFAGFGGGRGAGGFGSGKGSDIRATLEVSLEEVIAGTTRRIQFSDGRMVDVAIPKGASDGQVIRLKGQGAPGRVQSGDAMIELKIMVHPIYRRDGADLYMDLPVSVPDAVLGGKVTVPTPEGKVMMNIPKGSNSGKVLRLKGRGAFADHQRGDLFAKLMVTLPDGEDEQLIQFAEEWRKNRPYTPGK